MEVQATSQVRQIETVVIPAGAFLMGDENGRPDERPVHRVTLSAFRMAVRPATSCRPAPCEQAATFW